jgi:ribosomal protein L30E
MNCNTIICSNLTTGTDNVVLIPNQTIKTLVNTANYRLVIACNIPEATANYPVFIQAENTNVPVLCKYGNEVLANQLNRRVSYPIGYGNQNSNYTDGQFVILTCCNLNKRGTETTTGGAKK